MIPPQAKEVEESVLGAMLLEEKSITKVVGILNEKDFYVPAHQAIYGAMLAIFQRNEPADLITLTAELKSQGKLEKIGGEYYLTKLTTKVSSAANIEYHAHIVLEKSLARQIIGLSSETLTRAYDETENILELTNDLSLGLTNIRSGIVKNKSISASWIAKETNEEIDKIHTGQDESLKSGFIDIDAITGGYRKGNLIIMAGLEKSGKTTAALQTTFFNLKKGVPCLFFSLEMTRVDLMLRYALIEEKLSWLKLVNRKLTTLEIERLKRRVDTLGKLPFYVLDRPAHIVDIMAESARTISEKGIRLIVADYTQKIVPITKKANESREREVANISGGLKNIAFENKIVLIALSQLNEELRARESKAIEQDADKIITFDSPDKDEPTADGNGTIKGIRIRQRFGAGGGFGDCKMIYDKLFGYWKSYSGQDETFEPITQQNLIDDDPF
jgi:replicative DNA helicase